MPIWKVDERLYVGSAQTNAAELLRMSVHVLALCAEELQFPQEAFPGIELVHCPLEDSRHPISYSTWALLNSTAHRLAQLHRAGLRVLCTCHLGVNRSAFVAALTLREIRGYNGKIALQRVQLGRPGSLMNERFANALRALGRPSMDVAEARRR